MQLHTALVTLFNHPFKRVPIRCRSLPLTTCKKAAPWFYIAFIQCITLGSYLKYHGIDAGGFHNIQLIRQSFLHLFGSHSEKLTIDTLYPCASKLSFNIVIGMQHHCYQQCASNKEISYGIRLFKFHNPKVTIFNA